MLHINYRNVLADQVGSAGYAAGGLKIQLVRS